MSNSSGTTLDVTLSPDLRSELDQPGVYAYADYFGNNAAAALDTPVTLVNDGTIENDGTYALQLTDGSDILNGGKVYFFVQSLDPGTVSTLSGIITNQATITPETAATYDFGYDSFEISLLGGTSDAANLTAVNGFGLPMGASVDYDNGTSASLGYAVSGGAIAADIGAITNGAGTYTYSSGPLAGDFRLSTSPTAFNQNPDTLTSAGAFPQAAWLPYVTALENTTIASAIEITGLFAGAADANGVYHNGGYYAYQLQWDAATGDFWLVPLANSQIKGDVELSPDQIAENAYSQIGSVSIYTSMSDPTPFLTMGVGDNNQWGAMLAQFFTGFTGGYYGEDGDPLNPQLSGTIDLQQNFNWDPDYAFGNHGTSTLGLVANAATLTSDPYSQIFFANSNSYGSPYSDALMTQYAAGGPLLTVSQPGSAEDVSTVNLTLYADGETPQGYTPPEIYNYIAPFSAAAGYAIPTANASGANITLNFFSAVANSEGISLDPSTTVTLSILTGDTNGVPSWSTVTFDGATASGGLWQQWQITGSSTTGYQAVAAGTPLATGNLQILGLPTADSGVSWYQITVGAGTEYAKTYNLYTTTGDGGMFENPLYTGQQAALAIDGLATIAAPVTPTPAQYINTFTVGLVREGTVSYNPALVTEVSGAVNNQGGDAFPVPVPTAPVVGTLQNGIFSALAGQSSDTTGDAITTTVDDNLVFAWTGENNSAGAPTSAWISGYTNKVNAEDFAVITIENGIGQTGTISAQADIDGQWQTAPEEVSLGNGTYTITMQDHLAVSSGGTLVPGAPVTAPSDPLIMTVQSGANPLPDDAIVIPCFRAGTAIATPRGPVPVEALRIGDTVSTLGGAEEPIVWIGRRQVDCRRHPRPEQVWPVRIAAEAFGPEAPARDLFLSPDHAVLAGGVLIPVKRLVNGATIAQVAVETVTYVHIELARHEVVRAEGLAVETYLDTGDRAAFANGPAETMLHPVWGAEGRDPCLLDPCLLMEALGYAPLQVAGDAVDAVRALLAARVRRPVIARAIG